MAGGISYDDSGSLAAYFGLTFLSLVLVPTTFFKLKRALSGGDASPGKECTCGECRKKAEDMRKFKKTAGNARRFGKSTIFLILGWILAGALAYIIYRNPVASAFVYDPFEILGIAKSSTEKQIKRQYKLLSLKFHPDKIKLSENQTAEDVEAKYIELTKAYKSLTDEAIRENLRLFGNPDGQQPREEKIAIPKWVVEGRNGIWVLALYSLGLGVGIPFLVGRWWFSQKSLTKDGTLNSTAELFFRELTEDITFDNLISLISSAFEFRSLLGLPGGRLSGDPEKRDVGAAKEKKLSKKDRRAQTKKTEELEALVGAKAQDMGLGDVLSNQPYFATAASRRAAALLWSQLLRLDDISPDFKDERTRLLLALPGVLNSLLNIALAHHWLSATRLIMSLSSQLVQSSPSAHAPLSQLPGIDVKDGEALGRAQRSLREPGWQKYLLELNEESKKELFSAGALGEQKELSNEALDTAKRIPMLEVEDVFFKVDGERLVTPGSFVNFTYSVHLFNPNLDPSVLAQSVDKDKVESDEEKEEKLDEKTPLKKSSKKDTEGKEVKPEDELLAHAPRWPAHRKPHWWVMIGDPHSNKVVVQPQRIGEIPLQETATTNKTFKLQFQAPPNPATYPFEVYWISDTYLGVNVTKHILLKVDPVPAEGEDLDDDDISDPEEDTLAGQMAAMRGGKVKRSRLTDDEDESGSEAEEGDDSSDSDSEDEDGAGAASSSDSDSD